MARTNWTSRWWEISVVLLGVNSVVFGFTFVNAEELGWAIAVGFVPAILLLAGLGMRNSQRLVATVMLIVGSVGAAFSWWMIYTVVFALVVVVGGFSSGQIGPQRPQTEVAV